MPATLTYYPIPHAPTTARTQLAPTRRYARYAEIHPSPPLQGLRGTHPAADFYQASVPAGHGGRGVAPSYRALAPGGAGFCYRICTGTSESRLTAHYSLLTANSTYTFSAKEKDTETGYSYFGSRYYSDLSVWLSVDPMSGKYPSTSPYAYCRNNPIVLYDPDGMSDGWVIDKNNHVYWDKNAIDQQTTKHGDTFLGMEGQYTIGTEVWNCYGNGKREEQKPIIINKDQLLQPNIEADILCADNIEAPALEKTDKVVSAVNMILGLPVSASDAALKDEVKFITNKTSKIVIASRIVSRANILLNITSVFPAAIRVIDNPTPENIARLVSSSIGAGFNALPGGVVFSIIWNSIDAGGGFDNIYNKFK